MGEAKKNERSNALKVVSVFAKEFGSKAGMLKSILT